MQDNMVRSTRGIGWLLLLGGVVTGSGYGIYEFISDADVSFVKKVVVGAIYLGLAFLLISVLRQRVVDRETDKYKDVEI